ncbi:MAG TPA: putative Ig domain-containing protein, partial [Urbifossiella sp.]|nr:putative Ig domain-containing protein [Urbifossiella sp.]
MSRFVPGWLAASAARLVRTPRRLAARRPLAAEPLEARDVPATFAWTQTASGAFNWNDPANWTLTSGTSAAGFPNAADDVANLTGALTGNELINLNQSITVGALNVGASGGTGAYTIAANGAAGKLTFSTTAGPAALADSGNGGDAVLAPVTVTGTLTVSGGGAAPLTLGGDYTGAGTVTTSGVIDLLNGSAFGSGVTLAGGGTVAAPRVLYAESFYDGALYAFDEGTGALLATLVAPDAASSLILPAGLATGPDGNLYISEQGFPSQPGFPSNNAIVRYNLDTFSVSTFITSAQLQAIADPGATDTASFAPAGLRFGPDGNLYVSENLGFTSSGGGAVIRFGVTSAGGVRSYGGTHTAVAVGLVQPSGMTFGTAAGDGANLYVSTAQASVVKITGATGTSPTQGDFVTPGSGGLEFPSGLTFGPDGKLYVLDLGAFDGLGKVLRYNSDGTFDTTFVAAGTGAGPGDLAGQFPSDTLFDPAGHLLTANLGPNGPTTGSNQYAGSIYEYNSDGTFHTTLVSFASFHDTGGGATGIIPAQLAQVAPGTLTVAGVLDPAGAATGVYTAPAVTFAATGHLAVTLNGTTAGSGYDQLVSTGAVDLGGAALDLAAPFAATPGNTFTIVSSAAPIVGTFAGLPEGAIVTAGGQSFSITYAGGPAGHSVVLTRVAATAPAITTTPLTLTFYTGRSEDVAITATGAPAPTFTVTNGSLPTGLNIDPTTGHITGVPTAAGTATVDITATNASGGDTKTFTVTLLTGTAPQITSGNGTTVVAGTGGTFQVTTNGTPAPTVDETGALPAGVTFVPGVGAQAGTGTLTVATTTPAGVYTFTFTATNGVGTDASQSFTLTVDGPPQITSANATAVAAGVGGSFTVTTTGAPVPTVGETGALPAGVTFTPGAGAQA